VYEVATGRCASATSSKASWLDLSRAVCLATCKREANSHVNRRRTSLIVIIIYHPAKLNCTSSQNSHKGFINKEVPNKYRNINLGSQVASGTSKCGNIKESYKKTN
jgi:hypothetical protein